MTDALGGLAGQLSNLANMGADAMIEALAAVVGAIGEGTEFTGEQVARLGELEEQLSAKVSSLKG